jgi:uncharacterized protein (TIGR03118 family)
MFTLARSKRLALACAGLALTPVLAAQENEDSASGRGNKHFYEAQTLISDGSVPAANPADGDLINAWGLAFNPLGFAWVADNATGKATLYDGTGKKNAALIVTIPGVGGAQGAPTGIVFNAGAANTPPTPPDFRITGKNAAGADTTAGAVFIFASEDGLITGWAPSINRDAALVAKDNSARNAIYKGLAISGDGTRHLLYATDFHNARVDVWDPAFNEVMLPTGAFTDPNIPAGYAPFGIQAINGDVVVTFAKQDEDKEDDVKGRGLGFVDLFDASGKLVRRLTSHGVLNAPWGVALAPASFGRFGGALLIGNFGDGYIHAFGPVSGRFLGTLRDQGGQPIHIDGLWGMQFGNGVLQQPTNALFVAAGPDDEQHGTYGVIQARSAN